MGVRGVLITSTVISTVTLLIVVVTLPMFFMKMQHANTVMMSQLQHCHTETTDIWRQLAHESVRGKRSGYGTSAPAYPLGKCCSCQQGKPGPPGPTGPAGKPGQPGVIGTNGRNGIDGKYVTAVESNEPACQKCPPAPPGPPGFPGKKGPRGDAGKSGRPGSAGIPGRDGPPGPSGVRGPPGEIGMQGPQGDPGKVLNGAPQGQPGKAGKIGARGRAGLTGRDGRPGLEGVAGVRGSQGDRGIRGARGPPGPPGPAGPLGRKGTCAHCQTEPESAVSGDQEEGEEYSAPAPAPVTTTTTTTTTTVAPRTTKGYSSPAIEQIPQGEAYFGDEEDVDIFPKAINYPDTVHRPNYKHTGDAYGSSTARQYAAKTNSQPSAVYPSIGYSNDELISMAKPRNIQTTKGNVQIVGSAYAAQPVATNWANPGRPRAFGARTAQLSPPGRSSYV